MKKPFYTAAAYRDLEEILEYIANDKPDAAQTWVDKIEQKCILIASAPEIGEVRPQLGVGVRASFVGRYVIFHRHVEQRTEILRVIPGDREIQSL
ncbi:MAG: type II toxin-antitoxin system RelE/ParE family toxin [bacterium]|nr:type II toxin-antitoxin system RelE/ParE family toxin [bacterium]